MNDNIYKLFLNFLKFEDYPIDDSEDTKNKLFKLNNYSCWLEHYIQIQVYNLKYTKRDNDEDTINYFKTLAVENGIPYQKLMNLYLAECAKSHKKLKLNWK